MDKQRFLWYIGIWRDQTDIFKEMPKEATPKITGYKKVIGPFKTMKEAENNLSDW